MEEGDDLFVKRLLDLHDSLLNFAYILTRNKDLAKDLLQDTLMKALENRDKYVNNINLHGWASTLMRNTFINNYRRYIFRITMIGETEGLYHINLPQESGFETPDSSYTIKEINKIIASFPKDYRIPLSMHVIGFKYQDIADYMHLPLGTVKSRIFFARQRLRVLLKDYKDR